MDATAEKVAAARVSPDAAGQQLSSLVAVSDTAGPCTWLLVTDTDQDAREFAITHRDAGRRAASEDTVYIFEDAGEGPLRLLDIRQADGENADDVQEVLEDITCERCGAYNDDGEGWDGLCGNCADAADAAGEWDD